MMQLKEEKVTIEGTYPLVGTLLIPEGAEEGSFPAVLLVSGSGDGNRDGNFKKAKLFPNIYKDLAELITSLGFISLRVDKRGVGESGGNFFETGMMDLVDDIESCIAFLKNHPKAGKIILLGHSEGCTLITAANARNPVDGLIFLSGAAESTADALKRQRQLAKDELLKTKGLKGKLLHLLNIEKKIDKQAEKLNDKIMSSDKPVIRFQLQKINAKWFKEHFTYDVFKDLKKVTCPCLAIVGDKDVQVTPEKVHDLASFVKGPAEAYIIENMDHLLKEFLEEPSIMKIMKQYKKNQDKPLHPELKQLLSDWLKNQI